MSEKSNTFKNYRRCIVLLLSLTMQLPLHALQTETIVPPTRDTPANSGPTTPSRVLPGEKPTRKNYLIPLLEIPAFQFVLNRADRQIYASDPAYHTTWANGWNHVIHGNWVVDKDDFTVNQIGHPYQGTIYYGTARSSGLNFWESYLYTNLGSYVWETYGETTDPSINDQVASGTAGSFMGESLFRLSNLVYSEGGKDPGFLRKLAAGLISPPTMLNRILFGEHYGPTLESRHPAVFVLTQLGVGRNNFVKESGSARSVGRTVGMGSVSVDYGMPGKSGYRYIRPFDYFHFDISGVVDGRRTFDNLTTRGLLFGTGYELGEVYRGVWGLYGAFDYISPQIFRFSTTAVSIGTTGQWWATRSIAIQGTGLAGVGYGSAGTITPQQTEGDFHYGTTPQGLLDFRVLLGQRAALLWSGREYYITDHGASRAPGREHIQRLNSGVMIRTFGYQAIGIGYEFTHREAYYDALPHQSQRIGTVSLTYNILGNKNLGAVSW